MCLLALAAPALVGCAAETSVPAEEGASKETGNNPSDSSVVATFRDFDFDASLVADFVGRERETIEDQLLYTVGQLNADNSSGRIDTAAITNIVRTTENGRTRLSYHAKLRVAWGKKNSIPATYELILPVDISKQSAFASKYGHTCVDFGAHDVDEGSMFYYFRPKQSGCSIDAADIIRVQATLSPSPSETTGKYPEYNKVWEDNTLRVVAVFGKNEAFTTTNDVGISAYNSFVAAVKSRLTNPTTVPANIGPNPGVANPDVTYTASIGEGKSIIVNAFLVDSIQQGGAAFEARYAAVTPKADFIIYNGHAGLGANVRALARMGRWEKGQYSIVFINGCDTYAYVDSFLNDERARVNPEDPTGTKHLDIVMNAMPAFFSELKDTTLALVDALLDYKQPRNYQRIFRDIDSSQVVLVSGEEDNTFVPGDAPPPPPDGTWTGLERVGNLAKGGSFKVETPTLKAGDYTFTLSGTGDADLYVRIGQAPTATVYDCRPYASNSNETCQITLPRDAVVHVMIDGYTASTYKLVASQKPVG